MVLVDLYCPECEFIQEDVMVDTKLDDHGLCANCGEANMRRMVPGQISFELKYDNRTDMCDWDGNTSQYWNDIKKTGGDDPNADKWT